MRIYQDIHELVGNTPMLRLNHFPVKEGINLFAKLELWNPAGSVKDRLGEYFIKDAEERGELICGLEEGEEHTHTDDCYAWETVLSCGQTEEEPPPEIRDSASHLPRSTRATA